MRSKRFTKVTIWFLGFMLVLCSIGAVTFHVSAEDTDIFTGYSAEIDKTPELYQETNTYLIDNEIMTKNPNASPIMEGAPQITVLTHGMGGSAADWSNLSEKKGLSELDFANRYNFGYDPYSLIEQIKNRAGDADIYWARHEKTDDYDDYSFKLIKLNNQHYAFYKDDIMLENKITDISKHIIIVWEGRIAKDTNNVRGGSGDHYARFNYMLSKVIYDVKVLNGGILPKVNLIGHSFGGIINMRYALDHPDLVDSLISMGTPYFGSNTAAFAGSAFVKNQKLLADILDKAQYEGYAARWNAGYQPDNPEADLYSHINAHAIGGYSALDYLISVVANDKSGMIDNEWYNILAATGDVVLSAVYPAIALPNLIANDIMGQLGDGTSDAQAVSNFIASLGYENLDFLILRPTLYDDLLVHLPSQLGKEQAYQGAEVQTEYQGFHRYAKKFTVHNSNLLKVAENSPPVIHNLETRDWGIINYVVGNLDFGSAAGQYGLVVTGENKVGITGYYGPSVENLVLPGVIDGSVVTEIGVGAFSDNFYGKGIQSITLPNTIERIGNSAFENCDDLHTIVFAGGSQLKYVGDSSFSGCSSIVDFSFLSPVQEIGDQAFSGCSGMTGVTLNELESVEGSAFLGCSALQSIDVGEENTYYSSVDGILLNKSANRVVVYPSGKTLATPELPLSVLTIGAYAFAGNQNLQEITMSGVTTIEPYGFAGCSGLHTIHAESIRFVQRAALAETSWIETNSSLGKAFVKYQEELTELDETYFSGIESISEGAFTGNTTITSVILPASVSTIGAAAFKDCENIHEIILLNGTFTSTGPAVLEGCTQIKVKVPSSKLQDYLDNEYWAAYSQALTPIQTEVGFNSNEGSEIGSQTATYGSLYSLPIPERIGYTFEGWYIDPELNGQALTEIDIWRYYEGQLTLNAKWVLTNYQIIYHTGGGDVVSESGEILPSAAYYTILDSILLNPAEKVAHNFMGWYDNEEFTGEPIAFISLGSTGEKDYYAKWEATEYLITFECEGGTVEQPTMIYTYYDEFVFEQAVRPGYEFIVWWDKESAVGANGVVLGTYGNKTFFAKWQAIDYIIDFVLDGGSFDPDEFMGPKLIFNMDSDSVTLPAPMKRGYDFIGWYDNIGYSGSRYLKVPFLPDDSLLTNGHELTLYAEFSMSTYTITYHTNDGSINDSVIITSYRMDSQDFDLPCQVIKESYRFEGWYDNPELTGNVYSFIETGSVGNLELYADYVRMYNVTFKSSSFYLYTNNYYVAAGEYVTPLRLTNDGMKVVRFQGAVLDSYGRYQVTDSESQVFEAVWDYMEVTEMYNSTYRAYEIWYSSQFYSISQYHSSFNYVLMADIYLSGEWTPLPTYSGTFYGRFFTIYNLRISARYNGDSIAFIRSNYGTIINLKFKNVYLYNGYNSDITSFTGAIAAINYGSIIDCSLLSGNIYGYSREDCTGSVTGRNMFGGEILDCHSWLSIRGYGYIGGIAGDNFGLIDSCDFEEGNIYYSWYEGYNRCVGGIAGYNSGTITSCGFHGYIEWCSPREGADILPRIGYIIGYNTKTGVQSGNYVTGTKYINYYYWFFFIPQFYDQSGDCFRVADGQIGKQES